MAEFAEVMKQWRRMCIANSCEGCPLDGITDANCGGIYDDDFAGKVDWKELEQRVMAWAEEHPEPRYPSISEYLKQFGI